MQVEGCKWRVPSGGWQVEGCKWRVATGGLQVEVCKWRVCKWRVCKWRDANGWLQVWGCKFGDASIGMQA